MNKFDKLVQEEKLEEAMKIMTNELYKSGKIGGTRKMVMESIVDQLEVLKQRVDIQYRTFSYDIKKKDEKIKWLEAHIEHLESENKKKTTVVQNGENNYSINHIDKLDF